MEERLSLSSGSGSGDSEAEPPRRLPTDRYGFYLADTSRPSAVSPAVAARNQRLHTEKLGKWVEMLQNWGAYAATRRLRRRVRTGIPDAVRGRAWCCLAGVDEARAALEAQDHPAVPPGDGSLYQRLVAAISGRRDVPSEDVYSAIERDLSRTFPQHEYFSSPAAGGQAALQRVLHAYSVLDADVGYCQGMGFFTATYLIYVDEECAFYLLWQAMRRQPAPLRELYLPGMAAAAHSLSVLESLLGTAIPRVQQHLHALHIRTSAWASAWLLPCFSRNTAFPLSLRVWDSFWHEGWSIVVLVALALVKIHERRILALDTLEDVLALLRDVPATADADTVMGVAYALPVKRRQLEAALRAAASM